jgi:hypothetical protein
MNIARFETGTRMSQAVVYGGFAFLAGQVAVGSGWQHEFAAHCFPKLRNIEVAARCCRAANGRVLHRAAPSGRLGFCPFGLDRLAPPSMSLAEGIIASSMAESGWLPMPG